MITKTPGVCGGRACIGGTRMTVWCIVSMVKNGASNNELIEQYPNINPDDIEDCCTYYEKHRAEIEQDIVDQQTVDFGTVEIAIPIEVVDVVDEADILSTEE